ncbi:hypothetical protein R6Q59_027376 [Mikania micrantha]
MPPDRPSLPGDHPPPSATTASPPPFTPSTIGVRHCSIPPPSAATAATTVGHHYHHQPPPGSLTCLVREGIIVLSTSLLVFQLVPMRAEVVEIVTTEAVEIVTAVAVEIVTTEAVEIVTAVAVEIVTEVETGTTVVEDAEVVDMAVKRLFQVRKKGLKPEEKWKGR